jgi:NAD(P)H dehydrogenase (quinone)
MTNLAVTGSTGQLGGQVARLVADLRPRLVVRDPTRAPDIEGTTVARASYDDLGASTAALQGIDVLLMVSAAETPTRREVHRTFIHAAAEAGVTHIVYTSFASPAPDATFTLGRDHFDAEQTIRDTGLTYTFLRDNLYLDFIPVFANEQGVIRGPADDGRFAAVARADVAEVAATVLRSAEDHADAAYELTGPEALTMAEAAQRASAALGRPLRFEDESEEAAYAWRREEYRADDWQLDAWVSTYTAIRDGELAQVSDDVRRVTGHLPRTLEDVLTPRP